MHDVDGAVEIDRQRAGPSPAPGLAVESGDVVQVVDAGVVHHAVESAQGRGCGGRKSGGLIRIRQVGLQCHVARSGQTGDDGGRLDRGAAVVNGHLGAALSQQTRDARADTPAGAGDQDGLVAEILRCFAHRINVTFLPAWRSPQWARTR